MIDKTRLHSYIAWMHFQKERTPQAFSAWQDLFMADAITFGVAYGGDDAVEKLLAGNYEDYDEIFSEVIFCECDSLAQSVEFQDRIYVLCFNCGSIKEVENE